MNIKINEIGKHYLNLRPKTYPGHSIFSQQKINLRFYPAAPNLGNTTILYQYKLYTSFVLYKKIFYLAAPILGDPTILYKYKLYT